MGQTSSTIDLSLSEMIEAYMWETYQRQTISMPWGFVVYSTFPEYLFISDVYIDPRHRGQGIPRRLLEEIEKMAESVDRSYIGTKVHTLDKAWQNNLAICEHLGFGRARTTSEYIFMMKRRNT